MYLCTFVCTAYLLAAGGFLLWVNLRSEDDNILTTYNGVEINLNALDTNPSINELLKAVEEKNLEVIYGYAAPELKDKISFELFTRDQWPNFNTKDIKVLFTETYFSPESKNEHILLTILFNENGIKRYGSMRWEKSEDLIYYHTFPFKVTLLSEFSSFPTHIIE